MAQSAVKGIDSSPKWAKTSNEGEPIIEQKPTELPYEKISMLPEVTQKRFHSQIRGGSPRIIRTPLGFESEMDIASDY